MARSTKDKELFTASEVARFCQVDLKTIHNWSDRGEIRHFRTPGRHLRFRRSDVLDFLRRYGYPIPDVLASGKPRVSVLSEQAGDAGGRNDEVLDALTERFDVDGLGQSAACTLIRIGATPPDVVVLDHPVPGLTPDGLVEALRQVETTRHCRVVLRTTGGDPSADPPEDEGGGVAAVVREPGAGPLLRTLDALLGLDR
jgi:excisionase family DNA binding protein